MIHVFLIKSLINTKFFFFTVDQLPLKVISGIFERHQLQLTENSVQLDHEDLESVLSDIFFVIQRECIFDLDVENAVKLMINFLFNVFDKYVTIFY